MNQAPPFTNRLKFQKSPYLLQHAHNPVNWFSWSQEAFDLAKELNRPIFLSIGYATCHWCHVMEKESFQSEGIAKILNNSFINIKVDREELPDVDSIYMEFAQTMVSGAIGWPLNIFLTPALKPFFATTYVPAKSFNGMIGLGDLAAQLSQLWQSEEKEQIDLEANKLYQIFADNIPVCGDNFPSRQLVVELKEVLFKLADTVYGGAKGSPKFAIGYQYNFLLADYLFSDDPRSLFLAEKTLQRIACGGIYDHLRGGFARYSTDEKWRVPHFEKMLYDNAILAKAYLEAWKLTKNDLYKKVCMQTLDYLCDEMQQPMGGFFSAEDADSEGVEGLYYTWSYEEIKKLIPENYDLFCHYYNVTLEGNFSGRNILFLNEPLPLDVETKLKDSRSKLLFARKKRVAPFKDDKVLVSWNGLVIDALAWAARAFSEEKYLKAALLAARFITNNLLEDGLLYHRYREGEAKFKGNLDDHAFLIKGLISLFEVGAGAEWLGLAINLSNRLQVDFKGENGAFYQTDGSDPNLILRKCHLADGSEPSGNSIQAANLLKLAKLTGRSSYFESVKDIFRAVESHFKIYPPGYTYHAMNLNWYYDEYKPLIVISLDSNQSFKQEIIELIYSNYLLHCTIVWQSGDVDLIEHLPHLQQYVPIGDQSTIYICMEDRCLPPARGLKEISRQLLDLKASLYFSNLNCVN